MKTVVIGFYGSVLDAGRGGKRWEKWRPTLTLVQQEDWRVDRLILLHDRRHQADMRHLIQDIQSCAPETELVLEELTFQDAWDFEEVFNGLYQFAKSLNYDEENESYYIHITTGTHVAQICLFLLTEARYFPGQLVQTSPPSKKKGQMTGLTHMIDLDLGRYDLIASRFQKELEDRQEFLKSGIATRNQAFNHMIEEIELVAMRSRLPILLMGPTGAGKSKLAKRLFQLKKAKRMVSGDFVEINCSTIRGEGAMSTLFGHVRGAFTGALSDRPGLLRKADRGVLFLDEIGELGLDEQAMLLRALEDGRFLPLGGDREVESDFQLLAGTNRDLWHQVAEGRFRDDLLARINTWSFDLPPLRDRREDIEPNLQYELEQYAQKHGSYVRFNKEAYQQFLRFALDPQASWKGNFRDLNAAVQRMATLAPSGRINEAVVQKEIQRLNRHWQGSPVEDSILSRFLSEQEREDLDLFDQVQLRTVLEVCSRCRTLSEAGRILFASSIQRRASKNDSDRLRKYLTKFGLDPQAVLAQAPDPGV
ncbi:MAG: sigma 54-interacting transcriptional regulator [Acidobacteria bacterium]|nr:RNA repair transcriptional activator RtcR [Acidobacteriota bacterium]MCB9397289.1 sigma 54-interacting transcriptional regulator [Acidobacteriota bacterium]